MSMVYLALIAGSLFYLSRIILEFRAFEMSILPEVENSEKKIDRLQDLIQKRQFRGALARGRKLVLR